MQTNYRLKFIYGAPVVMDDLSFGMLPPAAALPDACLSTDPDCALELGIEFLQQCVDTLEQRRREMPDDYPHVHGFVMEYGAAINRLTKAKGLKKARDEWQEKEGQKLIIT